MKTSDYIILGPGSQQLRSTGAAHAVSLGKKQNQRAERTTPVDVVAVHPTPHGPMRLKTGDRRNNGESRVQTRDPLRACLPSLVCGPLGHAQFPTGGVVLAPLLLFEVPTDLARK